MDAFLQADDGFGVLTLQGEPGIGKTTIWAEGVRRAKARGASVLVARPAETETGLSFAGLADLFGSLPDELRVQLPEPQQEAFSAALLQAPLPQRGIDDAALFAAVLSILRMLAGAAPVVVAIDDFPWLDPPTARAVTFAARRLEGARVRFLITVRPGGASTPGFVLASERWAHVVEVGPLTLAALHEVVKQQTGHALARPTLVEVAKVCGGNPFYALEIALRLGGQTPAAGRIPVPASVTGLLEARLERLPHLTRQALLVAAALSHPTIDLVDGNALEAAEDEGIVTIDHGRIRFTHSLLASAVYEQADPSARRRLHGRLAAQIPDAEERARHLALSSPNPDEGIASELAAAAAIAAARGAPDAAARLVELAVEATPESHAADRDERRLLAAGHWFDLGDLARAQATIEAMTAGVVAGPTRARGLQLLGQIYGRRSSFADAIRCALQALESAGEDVELRAGIELDVAYCSASLGDFEGAQAHAREAATAAGSLQNTQLHADALGALTIAQFMGGGGLDQRRLDEALALDDPARPGTFVIRPSYLHGCLLLWMGRPAEALEVHEALLTRTRERGEEAAVPMLTLYLVWSCLWLGDLPRAARFAVDARETAALLGDSAAEAIALAATALVHAHDGSAALARQEAGSALAIFEQLQWLPGTIWPLWAMGLLELSAGNPVATDAVLGPVSEAITSMQGDVSLGVFLPDEIEALVERGDLERAEVFTRWLERRAHDLDRPWALAVAGRCRALLHHAARDTQSAVAALAAALAEHERAPIPLERARTLLVLGRVLRRTGKRAQAKSALLEAVSIFERVGTPLWADQARSALNRLGVRTSGAETLTPTESRVAELVAAGLSNREIAQREFLTVKAVEANLTRVYRKLAVRSRTQLAYELTRGDDRG